MHELALFAGGGGGILGGQLLGWSTVAAVEIEPSARQMLLDRQRDGYLPKFPIWDDVCTFDGRPWRGLVDVISGGFPCQDISAAGKGAGLDGERSGLWTEMLRIIREVRPRYALVENSPMLTRRGLGRVLGDLAEGGYNAAWGVLSAAALGAPHIRERIWIVATDTRQHKEGAFPYTPGERLQARLLQRCEPSQEAARWSTDRSPGIDTPKADAADTDGSQCDRDRLPVRPEKEISGAGLSGCSGDARRCNPWWEIEPGICRVVNGLANRVDRLKALGNGQVPVVAATAFSYLQRALNN